MIAARVGHEVLADGRVRLRLPLGGVVTDAEARRLAWALLSDLAPDEVVPYAEVVTNIEGQRLDVLRRVAAGDLSTARIAASLGWKIRRVQRRLLELVGDGRLTPVGPPAGRTYALARAVCPADRTAPFAETQTQPGA